MSDPSATLHATAAKSAARTMLALVALAVVAAGCSSDGATGQDATGGANSSPAASSPQPAVTVTSLFDVKWKAACEGQPIAEVAPYDRAGPVKVGAFQLRSSDPTSFWTYATPYTTTKVDWEVQESEYLQMNVVACFNSWIGQGQRLDCSGFTYAPAEVDLTFRASSTGQALGPTSHFTVVPDGCPDVAVIHLPDRVDYAQIDPTKMSAEIEAFLTSRSNMSTTK
jgi:hypothetical protein